ncbi:MAG: hypothetical protein A2905_03270 [Candidatus Levybacteria bacterium RIFCSPLOWO2_01_FULL_36_10]|nr:MAG: hypothetical protein A2905_03270 [Candidatus Levybacteria bacterium RIFCSPLOWO2_01_FULL_36_10]
MNFVYILKSRKTNKLYIGYTSDLRKRFIEHNNSESKYTQHGIPWVLVYYEAYLSRKDAQQREKQLKMYKSSYGFLKKRIINSLQNIEPKKRGEIEIGDEA